MWGWGVWEAGIQRVRMQHVIDCTELHGDTAAMVVAGSVCCFHIIAAAWESQVLMQHPELRAGQSWQGRSDPGGFVSVGCLPHCCCYVGVAAAAVLFLVYAARICSICCLALCLRVEAAGAAAFETQTSTACSTTCLATSLT